MPQAMAAESAISAVELDPVSARIARALYPSARIHNEAFQSVSINSGAYDLVIGNPPFGNQRLYDPGRRELSQFSIHNYFLAKSLDTLRPGGLMAMVVSSHFLDAQSPDARAHIADRAHLLGAIRLPDTAFKQNALTEVTTDIVFFQKAREGETPDRGWVKVGKKVLHDANGEAKIVSINRCFMDQGGVMLGELALSGRMYNANQLTLSPRAGQDLAADLTEAIKILPSARYTRRTDATPASPELPELAIPDHVKVEGYFILDDGRIAQRLAPQLDSADYTLPVFDSGTTAERIKGMIAVRRALRTLMQAERDDMASLDEIEAHRAQLNKDYDAFVKRFGFINSLANRRAMRADPEYALLSSLEHDYDRGIGREAAKAHGVDARPPSARKADIFRRRVMTPMRVIDHCESAKDALVVTLNESGQVDLAHMTRLTNKDEATLIRELDGLIYLNPASAEWESADNYLTGNVRKKLQAAREAAAKDRRYDANVAALEAVQPPDIDTVDIAVQLGSAWVPAEVVDQFVIHLLGEETQRSISWQDSLGKWLVKLRGGSETAQNITWGTEDISANELIEAILSNKAIQVKKEVGRDEMNRPIMHLDQTRTAAAQQKAEEIKQAFQDWVWEDASRRKALTTIYNERFNTNIARKYDGSHLTFPGASREIDFRMHQKDAVWRAIQDGTALIDHQVGAGKTFVMIATAMESR
ncbi:Eco57I restriction-modification methylase domain-containing protein, partial [bacterium]|nr:Eco57I restriction-modification methylase domain-containing protein [bacterium]